MQRTPTCQNCCRNLIYKDSTRPNVQRIPLLLKCGHTFCEACVNKWARQLRTHVTCLECQVVTPIAEGEFPVKSISPNLYQLGILTAIRKTSLESDYKRPNRSKVSGKIVQKALSQFSNQRKAAQLKAEGGSTCLKCEECFIAVASSRCPKCESVYCQPCFDKVHVSSNILRKHKPVPLTSTSDVTPGCPEHDNRPYEFYDKTVNQPVCSHCVVVGDRQGHDIVPATEVTVSLQDEFKISVEESKSVLCHLQKSEQKICEIIPLVNTEKSQVANDIREHFQKLHAALQAREEHLIEQVDERADDKNSMEMMRQIIAESIKRASAYIQEVEHILDDPLKLIAKTKQLSTQLDEMREIPCCAVRLPQQSDKERITYEEKLAELIATYGTVAMDGQYRFTMKKLSEVTEEDLKDSEEQPSLGDSVEESVEDDADSAANAASGMRRTVVASQLLHIPYRHELVRVTHISDPCHFVVQRLADLEQLNVIMNAINVSCEQSDDPSDLYFEVQVGTVCCSQFTVDNQWYRARVVNVLSPSNPTRYPTLENGLCVEVTYIDYGNNEWLPLSRLRKMKNKFLEVAELGVACSLVDIVPPFEEDKWPSKAIKAFGSLTGEKPLMMTVSDRLGGKLYVDLRTPEDDEPTQDNDRPASVRDALVFLEVARFTSPASRPMPGGQSFVPTRNFKEPTVIEKDSFVDVLVTHVINPEEICLHKIQADETLELDRIMKELSRMYGGSRGRDQWRVPWPYRGLVCGARFSEDGVWYRALITAVHSDETVDVSYVDFGNSETRPFCEIRKLPDMFLSLPKQAICACLTDIKPCGEATEWSEEVKSRLSTMLMNKAMIVKAQGCAGGKTSVLLYDTSHSYDVCINDLMVQSRLAEPAGMGLVKSREEQLEAATVDLPEVPPESEVEETPDAFDTQGTIEMAQTSSRSVPDPSPSHFVQYVPPDLPQQKRFLLGVTYVDDDGFIYGQEMKEGDRTLIEVMSELQRLELIDIPDSNFSLAPGLPCCALYVDDGMWYRARVMSLCQDGKVLVNYIDFGNSEAVELQALRLETPFMHIPQQCLQLVLHGIEPNTTDGRWPAEVLNMLKQLIIGAECLATIKSQRLPGSPFLVVKLALADGIDVTSWMLSKGLGRVCIPKAPYGAMSKRKMEVPATQDQPPVNAKTQAKAIIAREVNSMLAHTKLPELGVEFDVTITQIDQPDCVFIQRVPPLEDEDGLADDDDPTVDESAAELQELEDMAQRINKPEHFKKLLPLTTAWEGMLCCGNYTQDDMWYRAEVLSVECEKPLECRVLYIDYGTSEIIRGDRLRGFPSILLDLPRQAVRCRIGDILPPLNFEGQLLGGTQWPVDAMEKLIELVAGKKLIAKILCRGPPVCVLLCERFTLDDSGAQDISIGKQLAEKGLALHLGPDQSSDVDSVEVTPAKKLEDPTNPDKEESEQTKTFEFLDDELRLPFFKEEETQHSTSGAEAAAAMLEKLLAPPPKTGFASTPGTKLLTPSQIVGKKSHARSDSPRKISANIGLPATREDKENDKNTAETQDGNRAPAAMARNEEEKNTIGVQEEKVLLDTGNDTNVLSGNQPESAGEMENVVKGEEGTKPLDGEDAEEKQELRVATTENDDDNGEDTKQREEAPDDSRAAEPSDLETGEGTAQGDTGVPSGEASKTGDVNAVGAAQGDTGVHSTEESKTGNVNEDYVESAV